MLGGAYHASSLESASPTHASRSPLSWICEKGGNSDGDCQGVHEQTKDSVQQTSGEEEVKSKVNAGGNYTKPEMRKRLFNAIKSQSVQGTAAGEWSARKAQLLAKQYKAKGGGYK